MTRASPLLTTLLLSACCSMPAMYDCWICEQERAALGDSSYEEYPEEPIRAPVAAVEPYAEDGPEETASDNDEADIIALTNHERQAEGLSPLTIDERLIAAARQHSQEMCELNYFSHRSPTPGLESLAQRGKAAGIDSYRSLGENIASTTAPSPEAFVEMWMNSEGHRKNILRTTFTHIGVGTWECGSTTFATQMFGTF